MGLSIAPRASWIDHLRSTVTLLVIAHHAALAYTAFSTFDPSVYILSTHPVVDKVRWPLLDFFVGFNDAFFMPLMFLISGVFTLTAIKRKGARIFMKDRFRRLFIPFILAVTILMPIAYYPAWLLSGRSGITSYLIDYFTVEAWPVGPPWFIWVLFLFNLLIVILPKNILTRPRKPIITLIVITVLLYTPAALLFGSYTWTGIGPFDFQKSRLLLYFGYFLTGAALGTSLDRHLKKWPWWMAAAVALYIIETFFIPEGSLPHIIIFPLITATASIAFLALFKALSNNDHRIWRSLSANAYGMYLTHYIFVVWCQYALLNIDVPAAIKFFITFIVSVAASWLITKNKSPRMSGGQLKQNLNLTMFF